jgi:tRNA pseudouridine32 synthase / 23S rRNA pseudouridine746 synthase
LDPNHPNYFNEFKSSLKDVTIDSKFVYPFYYSPTQLGILAAEELKDFLNEQKDWEHDFGMNNDSKNSGIGKMFGVLVVKNQEGKLGYLAAFSGKLAGKNHLPHFVPPVFDMLEEDGFFLKEIQQLNEFNRRIKILETDEKFIALNKLKEQLSFDANKALTNIKDKISIAKAARKTIRQNLSQDEGLDHDSILASLRKESITEQAFYKNQRAHWKLEQDKLEIEISPIMEEIQSLKLDRKNQSSDLQQQLFDNYKFLNNLGEQKNIGELFSDTYTQKPPAAAGECAAPKLLQYAYNHGLQPITIAEFWWGQSPKSDIRVHGQYYPACRGKCGPILAHMLKGLEVAENPMLKNPAEGKSIEIIYQDEYLVVINKPAEFLAVPGIHIKDSVTERMRSLFPNSTGPLVVHRLDMSTSGIMLIALTSEVYIDLQKQFIERKIHKEYEALLEGNLSQDKGEIRLPLRLDIDDRPRQLVCFKHGKSAHTNWEVIERKDGRTRVLFQPITGRTHQLRVHAAHSLGLNAPIVGDDLYGKMENRLHLHAAKIIFVHPVSKETMEIKLKASF